MKLKAPEGCGGVSFDGQEYRVKDGIVEVPDQAAVFLEPGYGFEQIGILTSAPEKSEKEKPERVDKTPKAETKN